MTTQTNKQETTYRMAVQSEIEKIQMIYDRAGYLRDHATIEEKNAWNNVRGLMYNAAQILQKMDNLMTDRRAGAVL